MDKSKIIKNRAFTFAELMISLVVISVVSAILYPTIAQFTPNSNKPLFKSAYKTLNEVIAEIIDDTNTGELHTGTVTAAVLCQKFCEKTNVVYPLKSGGTPETTCTAACSNTENGKAANTITTSNGMRWRFYNYGSYSNPNERDGDFNPDTTLTGYKITVDVNAANNNLSLVGCVSSDLFKTDCDTANSIPETGKTGCGVFMYEYSNDSTLGIFKNGPAPPNYSSSPVIKESFNHDHLKNQDTFEIIIDKKGKIIGMSPAAWANLEDIAGD